MAIGLTKRVINFLYGEYTNDLRIDFQGDGLVLFNSDFEHVLLS